jgi:uncharacterized protein YhjY with autotransporter beta-barrel domain
MSDACQSVTAKLRTKWLNVVDRYNKLRFERKRWHPPAASTVPTANGGADASSWGARMDCAWGISASLRIGVGSTPGLAKSIYRQKVRYYREASRATFPRR